MKTYRILAELDENGQTINSYLVLDAEEELGLRWFSTYEEAISWIAEIKGQLAIIS